MKVVVDTNVFISGVFFTGPPNQILKAWRDGRLDLAVSAEILEEYQRVSMILSEKYPEINVARILDLMTVEAKVVSAPPLPEPVCQDQDDDKFLACALAAKAKIVISGDKHLLDVSGYRAIEINRPREFLDRYLAET